MDTPTPNPAIRFIVFRWDMYYPGPGLNQVMGQYPTIEAARAAIAAEPSHYDSYQSYDTWTGASVMESTPRWAWEN